jgi:serine/threonine-protein kinase HipA
MVERVCESAVEVGREVIAAARNEPRWRDVAKGMVHAWNEGMASLRSVRLESSLKGLTDDIDEVEFSDPPPPEPLKTYGHSELPDGHRSGRRRRAGASTARNRKSR